MKNIAKNKGFTLIELLVVIAIIALLSSVIFATLTKSNTKARDSARIQNARQIALALEQYEQSNNTYKIPNAGLNNEGSGYISKGDETPGYTTSISSALKSGGFYNSSKLIDPVYGTDNYYVGVCTSTNAFNVFIKLEQPELSQGTSTLTNACGGAEASALGFNYVASTVGGTSGGNLAGGGEISGGGSEPFTCGASIVTGPDSLTYGTVIAEDGRCWLDRNLGATKVAASFDDVASYGDYYQWGRGVDGHEKTTSVGTSILSPSDSPGNNNYINNPDGCDWRETNNDNLWQGVAGVNNPCPTGFRVPTRSEWTNQFTVAGINNYTNAYNSILKLPTAGYRDVLEPYLNNFGISTNYWTSTTFNINNQPTSGDIYIDSDEVNLENDSCRMYGYPIRCIKN